MFLNGYTILSVFFCGMRLCLSLLVVGVAFSSWRLSRRTSNAEATETIENRSYLLFLAATVLIAVNVVSWPVMYLLLQSYVQEWPSIMCIYGVTQIGSGTQGASRFLPALLTGLTWTKPVLVFVCGAAYVLYLINRRTRTAPLRNRVLLVMLLVGAGTMVDSLVEAAYLLIPKTEIRLTGGCCTNALEMAQQTAKFTPRIRVDESERPYLITAYYAMNLAMIVGLFAQVTFRPPETVGTWLWLLLIGGVCSIPVSLLYLIEVAAPAILGLPFHHCAYDLVSAAPESLVGVSLFLLGSFSVGWSFIAQRFGSCDETGSLLPEFVSRLLFVALFGYVGSLLLMSVELFLA